MRSFPSARWLVAATAVLVTLALTLPNALADDRNDLTNKQRDVQGQINSVKGQIHEASDRAAALERRLTSAQGRLRSARATLRTVEANLRSARRTAVALAAQLKTAEARLVTAKQELAEAKQDVVNQRAQTRDTTIARGTSGDPQMALVSSYVKSGSLQDAMFAEMAYGTINGRQDQSLAKLNAAQDAMQSKKNEVQGARNQVATTKAAADRNVTRTAQLVDRAQVVEGRVQALVTTTAHARRSALQARAADRARLRRLEKREQAIKARIIALSRKQTGNFNGNTGGFLFRPASGPVTSPYGWRIHPIYGYWGLHNGTDFGTGCGAPLYAGESGTVIDTYYDEIYGNRLYLAIGRVNGASIVLVYNHMTRYAAHEGQHLKRGQVVGYSGSTGWSTGCHLHFIVMRNGEPVDPMQYL